MAIKTGIGVGAAQVFDTSGIMNTYARQIAQQQRAEAAQAQRDYLSAEKEKERSERASAKFDEDLADIMASAKLGGIRDIDVEEITKAYNEVKDFYSKSGSLKDSQKPLFRAELRNRMNTINDAAINSIEVEKKRYAIASKVAENPWDYDPKVIQDLDYINKTPLSKLGALANMDPITYQKVPNVKLLDNIMSDVNKLGQINAQYSKEEKIGSDKYKDVSIVDKAYIQKNLIQGVMNSPEAFSSVKRIFTNENPGQQPTDQALTEFLTKKYEEKYPYIYKSDIKKQPAETGGLTKSESKELANKDSRRRNVVDLIDNSSQDVFDLIKATLPPSSIIKFLKVEGKGVVGIDIDVPKTRDPYGEVIGAIKQRIDFTKGNPYATVNNILNTYTGKKFSSEELFKGAKTTTKQVNVNTPKPTSSKPDVIQDGNTFRWNGTKYVFVK